MVTAIEVPKHTIAVLPARIYKRKNNLLVGVRKQQRLNNDELLHITLYHVLAAVAIVK